MFSKPLVVAGLIAGTNAAATLSGILTQAAGTAYGQLSCFDCFMITDGRWVYRDDSKAWMWSQSAEAVSGTKDVVVGGVANTPASAYKNGFCCKDKTTLDFSGAGTKACDEAYSAGTTVNANFKDIANPAAGNWNLLSQIAICPAWASVCGAPEKTTVGSKATLSADKRTAVLTAKGDAVTLKMAVPASASEAKKWKQEQCSYVVKSNCGAPIITIEGTSDAAANDYKLYFMEYTGAAVTAGSLTLTGASGTAYFLPVATKVQNEAWVAAASKMPNDELATVGLYTGTANTSYMRSVPGQALYSWMASIQAGYTNYDSTVVEYEKARKEWDDGKRGAKPWQPKQPDAPPALLDQLKAANTLKAAQGSGFGAITQYQIEWGTVNKNAGKYFGTLAGVATRDSAAASSISTTAKHSYIWATNSGKTAAGTGTSKCDPAYVQVTGHLKKVNAAAAAKMWVIVTEGEWAKTLEESIPKRPVATTAPKASGAAYLTVGATAALVALSLS